MKKYFQYSVVVIIALTGFTNFCTAQHFDQDYVRFSAKGSTFTFQSLGLNDTLNVTDPIGGKVTTKIVEVAQPVTMNGKKIYEMSAVTTPPKYIYRNVSPPEPNNFNVSIEEYILNSIKDNRNLRSLDDGIFRLHLKDLVVDENGKIVYYYYWGTYYMGTDNQVRCIGADSIIDALMANAPIMKPAMLNGEKVIVRLPTNFSNYIIEVNNQVITYRQDNLIAGKSKF